MWESSKKPISINGLRLAAAAAGVRYPDRLDMCLVAMEAGSEVAGVFTQNLFCAAPVSIAKENLKTAAPRFFLINTGSANAGTGDSGVQQAKSLCRGLAELAQVSENQILPFSTGVIGEGLPVEKMQQALPTLLTQLAADNWETAATAIMTTDTRPKWRSYRFQIGDQWVNITGMAKGAGMIKPNMATMLAFIATDCLIQGHVLQKCLQRAVEVSFNAITVDGDTSTNDALMLVATGKSNVEVSSPQAVQEFQAMLDEICRDLAKDLIRDAEGASKFISIRVLEGRNSEECRKIAFTVAESPLFKTAAFASDANWGRILAAVGRSRVPLDINKIRITLGEVDIVRQGQRAEDYREAMGQAQMAKSDIEIGIYLGLGEAEACIWTSDLSYDYIKINAEYRT